MTYPIQNIIETALLDDEFEANLNFQQNKVLNNIINCKTSQMGGHTLVCNDCGNQTIHYNSCRDRHCPCCQTIEKEKWIDRMNNSLVDAPYFHIVATVPHELNTIFLSNQKSCIIYFMTLLHKH